jgi:hypothetical protein
MPPSFLPSLSTPPGERGEVVFKGRIRIPQHAQMTDSAQLCRSVMLGNETYLSPIPYHLSPITYPLSPIIDINYHRYQLSPI